MSITRSPRPESNFYILSKSISEDRRLSWAARGMLIFLLGKPDNWNISIEHLRKETIASVKPSGRDAVYALLGELITAGYVKRDQDRESGQFMANSYTVSESPLPENPDTANPDTANPTLTRTDFKQGMIETNSCPPQAGDLFKFRFAEVQEAYNRICSPTLPACRSPTKARQQQVRLMADIEFNGKRPFREHAIPMVESYFSDCLTNKHWIGDNDRGWKADFDFVTKPKNVIKLLERICG